MAAQHVLRQGFLSFFLGLSTCRPPTPHTHNLSTAYYSIFKHILCISHYISFFTYISLFYPHNTFIRYITAVVVIMAA